jgi:uncharacterized membrane protein
VLEIERIGLRAEISRWGADTKLNLESTRERKIMSRKTIISLVAAATVAIPCFIATDAMAVRGGRAGGFHAAGVHGGAYRGGAYRGGAYRGGAYRAAGYRGGVYRGGVWRPGVGVGAAAVGAAAVGAAATSGYYNSQPCGYYPYPPCQ